MENEQDHLIHAWASYLCQTPFTEASFDADTIALIRALFVAQQNGYSCIITTASRAATLQDLLMPAQQGAEIKPFVYAEPKLYMYRYWALEQQIAADLHRIQAAPIKHIELSPRDLALLSDPHQLAALKMVSSQALNIITGGPGTGKTYTLARLIAVLNDAIPELRIAMAAPTGKAAQRMKEALQASMQDPALAAFHLQEQTLQPVTMHRLLGLGHRGEARFHAKQPLPYDLIVVDEASMLDLNMAKMLFAAVAEGTRMILLGDAQQLASVDVGAVLADLQSVVQLAKNRVHLHTSRRFHAAAKIGQFATFIQANQSPEQVLARFETAVVNATSIQVVEIAKIDIDHVQLEYLPESLNKTAIHEYAKYYQKLMYGYAGFIKALAAPVTDFETWVKQVIHQFDEYRILAAVRHGPLGLDQLNEQIENQLLTASQQVKKGQWYVGRPVMMSYNDYQLGLSNGDIGLCFLKTTAGSSQFEVYFPSLDKWLPATRLPKNMQTAYALTIHKSQGSEFSHTAVVLDVSAQELLAKELIYTAITRAKKVVTLLAHPQALAQALTQETCRQSGLAAAIEQHYV